MNYGIIDSQLPNLISLKIYDTIMQRNISLFFTLHSHHKKLLHILCREIETVSTYRHLQIDGVYQLCGIIPK